MRSVEANEATVFSNGTIPADVSRETTIHWSEIL